MTTNKNTIRYIDETTAQVTKAFQKNSSIFGTDEFKLWREYKAMFPEAVMVTKTIKKNPNKLNITKNMTYENMAAFIREQDDAAEVMKEFQKQINLSKVKANPYRAVLAWFKKKYPDVNDYMNYFEELAAKKSAENDMFAVPAAANF
ncbi:hypothetical protein KQI82_04495 [Oscillibacter sp. MSJ-2]|uniref:RxLR effector protein n=1 Tax=Dysosmobacter acutus TaxID=2841504 RepID=A0ABS6F7D1_9FIRM|nr:hypothetical protein [Dysosmobacter acutus]MBU5626181.1 hypothetical protein [Dysosmobacter acutus]